MVGVHNQERCTQNLAKLTKGAVEVDLDRPGHEFACWRRVRWHGGLANSRIATVSSCCKAAVSTFVSDFHNLFGIKMIVHFLTPIRVAKAFVQGF